MNAHTPIQSTIVNMDPANLSARDLASSWRKYPDERAQIEAVIQLDGRGDEFRSNAHGELIAKFTDADRQRRIDNAGCDVRARSDKSMGYAFGLEIAENGYTPRVAWGMGA